MIFSTPQHSQRSQPFIMSPFFATLLRTVLVFGSFLGIQYFIAYYFLVIGGIS